MRVVCDSWISRNTSKITAPGQHPCAPSLVGGITCVLGAPSLIGGIAHLLGAACASRRQERSSAGADAATLTTSFQHVAGVCRALTKAGPIFAIHIIICARLRRRGRCRSWAHAATLTTSYQHVAGVRLALTTGRPVCAILIIICAWPPWCLCRRLCRCLCRRLCRCLSRCLSWCLCWRGPPFNLEVEASDESLWLLSWRTGRSRATPGQLVELEGLRGSTDVVDVIACVPYLPDPPTNTLATWTRERRRHMVVCACFTAAALWGPCVDPRVTRQESIAAMVH